MNYTKKVRLFTHTDMDGYAALVVARCYFKEEDIFVEHCNYDNVDDRVEHFMNTVTEDKQYVFITDISVKREDIADKLDICDKLFPKITVKLLDHHQSALHLNKYDFAKVMVEKDGELICGAKLFYQYLVEELGFKRKPTLEKWLKIVNDYDTWLWENKYHYELPKFWNELFFTYDNDTFVDNVLKKIKKGNLDFNDTDNLLLNIEHSKQANYIKGKLKTLTEKKILGYNCVICFAEQYLAELATAMYEANPDSDIQIIITSRSISYRCRNNDNNVNLSEFAANFGGGGHAKAAGSVINKDIQNEYLKLLFNE